MKQKKNDFKGDGVCVDVIEFVKMKSSPHQSAAIGAISKLIYIVHKIMSYADFVFMS